MGCRSMGCAGGLGVGVLALVIVSCGGSQAARRPAVVAPGALVRGELPECGSAEVSQQAEAPEGDPLGREAAQRGLAFLARDTLAWQGQHGCYGCHVQAVTLDAMIVGRRHHYDVPAEDFDGVLRGMLDIPGGAHGPVGFSVQDNPSHLIESSKSFGGAALAEYDEHIAPNLSEELLRVAEALLEYQEDDGSVRSTDPRPPVVAGLMQSTTQAARTWRQAYARSADDRWLPPISRAETYIRTRASQLTDEGSTYLQDLSYAIIGLLATGAGAGEGVVALLATELRERQNEDGGWGFRPGEQSNAFATGQSLYVLKRLGTSDSDEVARRGTHWLVERQRAGGGWSDGGERRGEAMWAVLGLVSIDVLSVTVRGVEDGQHTSASIPLRAEAVDSHGQGAASIELRLDDVPIHRSCGGSLSFDLDPAALEEGAHFLDVVATNTGGQVSRRRLSFYSGDHFLTRVGTRFEQGSTHFSLRNVAPELERSRVRLRVFRSVEQDGRSVRGERVHHATVAAAEGAMSFEWNGRSSADEAAPRGRYLAELAFVDGGGRVRQTVELPFVHDTDEAQHAQFGEVAGRIDFDEAEVAGAEVELVDSEGRVMQRATSTRSGRYRFRNVDRGRYRVRVRRRGFEDVEATVEAAPASAADADLSLQAN